MAYIDKKIAMQYLANSEKIFDKLKTNFLNTYKNFKPQMESYIKNNDFDSIHNLIHQIKGISLNIGSEVLYDDSIKILDEIRKKGEVAPFLLECYIETFEMCYLELSKL